MYLLQIIYKESAELNIAAIVVDIASGEIDNLYIWRNSHWIRSEYKPKNVIIAQMWLEDLVLRDSAGEIEITSKERYYDVYGNFYSKNFQVRL